MKGKPLFYKENLLTTILLSTVALSQVGTVISVELILLMIKIATQDSKIKIWVQKNKALGAEVDQIQSQVSGNQNNKKL